MTIKNVVRTNNAVLSVAGGSVSSLASDPIIAGRTDYNQYHGACKRGTAWFEGRLYTFNVSNFPGNYGCWLRRWDNNPTPDTWECTPDLSGINPGVGNTDFLQCILSYTSWKFATPGLISYKDNIYLFWDAYTAYFATNVNHSWGYLRWNPATAPNGSTTVEAWEGGAHLGYYKQTYTKTGTTRDHGHILDLIEYNGNIYVATPINIMSMAPPSGDMILLEEPSTNWDNMVARSFGLFKTGSGIAMLLMLDANGKVKQVTGAVSEIADLKLINANITNGNTTSLGYGTAILQIGANAYAFLNDTTGTVLFRSSNGTSWTEISGSLPAGWRTTYSHVKYAIDPSVPEVRIMFVNAASNAFDIYTFDGTTFSYLGSGSPSANVSYTYFDVDAADAELEGTVTVNVGAGTASIPFQMFREATATGTVNVEAEYSVDGGATWSVATGTPKTALNASDSRPAGTGASYTFVWNWLTDLGAGLFPNVRVRIRAV